MVFLLLIGESIGALLSLYFMDKKLYSYFVFSKNTIPLACLYSILYALTIYFSLNSFLGYPVIGHFMRYTNVPFLLLVTIYPPIIAFSEEIIFRGYLANRLTVPVSVVLFTILHWRPDFPLLMFIVVFFFALTQTLILYTSKNIWVTILSHMAATYAMIFFYL